MRVYSGVSAILFRFSNVIHLTVILWVHNIAQYCLNNRKFCRFSPAVPVELKQKYREYNIPLCVAFVDYEKEFDSVQTQAILTPLQEQGIEDVCIEILKDIYMDSSVTVHLHKESQQIRINRGIRQGDTISPKLFTATLEIII